MIRAQAFGGGDVVHLWMPDPVTVPGHALCGVAGPAVREQNGQLCLSCWRTHGGSLGSAFTRATAARGC
ncbi:hypothetical protein LX86_001408 [Lentzea aerocolonigenes]|nr:hypothetical protein [Lentzea aerocolonigenes]